MNMDNPIIAKIQKLQALADNAGTEAEAALAASRVADLCRAHNLDIGVATLEREEKEASESRHEHRGRVEAHWVYCANAVTNLFGVGYYRTNGASTPLRDFNGRIVSITKGNPVIVFYGLKASVAAAMVTYEYLLASVESMLEGWIRGGASPSGVSGLRSFRLGCSSRMHQESEKFAKVQKAQIAAAPESTALVRLEGQLMKAHAAKMHLRTRSSGFSGASDGTAYSAGYAAGGRVDLHGARSSRMLA